MASGGKENSTKDKDKDKEKDKDKDKDKDSSNTNRNRFHSPPVELPSSNAQNFFEEAKITSVEETELRRKFGKFCTRPKENPDEETYLALDDFCRMLQYYECASAQNYEAYFHAIDRNHDDKLDFQEFFLGCCAADPSTVHILNSFTGYERSQYIFDFYDTNRSQSLEFDEFARLTADCMSLPSTNPNDEEVKRQAIEKARDLGAVEESGNSTLHFMCIKFKKFYEFIQNERLRGTSRLFRFSKSIIKSRVSHHSRRAQGSSNSAPHGQSAGGGGGASGSTPTNHTSSGHDRSSGQTPTSSHAPGHGADDYDTDNSGREDCEWHAHLLDLDELFDPDGDELESFAIPNEADRSLAGAPPPYAQLLPPPPAPSLRLESDPPPGTDAKTIARKVLKTLSAHHYDGLLTGGVGLPGQDAPFSLVQPAQLRCLCNAAVRLLELEDMVLTELQPPVKVFGGLHGQLLDLLSHFKWHQAPVEENGDILYTTYVFLGDYADRGGYGLEVLTLLLSLKVAQPARVVLLRGHHENRHLNYHLGLRAECEKRLGSSEGMKIFEHLNRVFDHMSLAAVIEHHASSSILALGPGVLPTSLARLEQLRRYKKPLVLPHVLQPRAPQPLDRLNEQVLLELFTPSTLMPREFGAVREASSEKIKYFCSQHRLAAIVRSRQVPGKGFSFDCGGRFITVSSCTNYCDLPHGNDAAILCITKEAEVHQLAVRPKVLTAHVAKIHRVVGKANDLNNGVPMLLPARWPTQARDATPGRVSHAPLLDDTSNEQQAANEAVALVIHTDRTIVPDLTAAMDVYPAFGPGRPPGGFVRREGRGPKGVDSPHLRTDADGQEDWALLTASASGRSSLPDRRSLGSRRGSGPKGQESTSKTRSSGKAFADPIVTQVLRQSEQEEAGITPKGGSPERRQAPRTPGGGGNSATPSTSTPIGSSSTKTTGTEVTAGSAQRRGGPSPSDPNRLSMSTQGGGTSAVIGASSSAGSGANTSRESKTASGASGGRNTPQSGGVAAASQDRRSSDGSGKSKNPPQAQRTSGSRPPGATSSPKAATASSKGGTTGSRRTSGPEGDYSALSDPQTLSRLLQEHSRNLTAASLPSGPSALGQMQRIPEQPLVAHLCKLWTEAGLGDREWAQALHMFDTELSDQLRQTKGGGSSNTENREVRWTLETFSMWLLKRGRRLRECSQWFRAFDFDHDDMIGICDFLQGLVAAGTSRTPGPSSPGGLCSALALFRLLDLEKRQTLELAEVENILGDAQVSLGPDFPFSLQQVAQRVTDFEFFRASMLQRLQGAAAFRLARVFGPPQPE
jgi:protein phosphatase